MAFMDFQPTHGFLGSEWVWYKHFGRLLTEPKFFTVFRNTIMPTIYNLIFYFPFPIILAAAIDDQRCH